MVFLFVSFMSVLLFPLWVFRLPLVGISIFIVLHTIKIFKFILKRDIIHSSSCSCAGLRRERYLDIASL